MNRARTARSIRTMTDVDEHVHEHVLVDVDVPVRSDSCP